MIAEIRLWNRTIGAASSIPGDPITSFQYDPDFIKSGIEVSPLHLPLRDEPYRFPQLARETFHGLPGLLADALPDRFGNAVIDAWLASEGHPTDNFNALERLCYTGNRGMGALEFRPMQGPQARRSSTLDIDTLVNLATEVLTNRSELAGNLAETARTKALNDILQVGTSAGGARAKAVIAWNLSTNEMRSGQIERGSGFEYWLLKFDGIAATVERGLTDLQGYGAIEYAYNLMAIAAGITMSPCRLFEERGRRHFMTRRFDRTASGEKLHMQTLGGLAHFDYNQANAHSYEQVFAVMEQLGLTAAEIEEQFRRMLFNIVARNQDDHVKNIAFLMDKAGRWALSPAYDITYAYKPGNPWLNSHQLSLNGQRKTFTRADIRAIAKRTRLPRGRADTLLEEVTSAVQRWPEFASEAIVHKHQISAIGQTHRLEFVS
jgi:serine/threonine-protein kinase HipA|tara:strand:+ start:1838 stop:3139 length:1302 start_codon:yes stop_codon:yes gene_type:complete